MRLPLLVLFLLQLQQAAPAINFEKYGALGLLVYLVGEKLIPAVLNLCGPTRSSR